MVHRISLVANECETWLVYLARRQTRWSSSEQLGEYFQRFSMGIWQGNRSILSSFILTKNARRELGVCRTTSRTLSYDTLVAWSRYFDVLSRVTVMWLFSFSIRNRWFPYRRHITHQEETRSTRFTESQAVGIRFVVWLSHECRRYRRVSQWVQTRNLR